MLREENKPVVRVRVCGDLARFVDEEDLELGKEAAGPATIAVLSEAGICSIDVARLAAAPEIEHAA